MNAYQCNRCRFTIPHHIQVCPRCGNMIDRSWPPSEPITAPFSQQPLHPPPPPLQPPPPPVEQNQQKDDEDDLLIIPRPAISETFPQWGSPSTLDHLMGLIISTRITSWASSSTRITSWSPPTAHSTSASTITS